MAIALVSPGLGFPPYKGTSVEIYLHNLSRELGKKRKVIVYGRGLPKKEASKPFLVYRPISGAYLQQAVKTLVRDRPRIIQVDNRPHYVTAIRCALPRTPIILNLHSLTYVSRGMITKSGLQAAFRSANTVVANSHYLRRALSTIEPSAHSKIHVIHPGVDLHKYPSRFVDAGSRLRLKMRQREGVQGKVVVLYVGRFIPRKGIDVLLNAFRRVHRAYPNAVLWIVGGRPTSKTHPYHRRIAMLGKGLPVRYFGYVSQFLLPNYYLAADIFVCPSQQSEAFGLVNIEAAATGLPIVASNNWGVRESVMDQKSGLLVKAYHSPDAFSRAILRLCASNALRETMGKGGRRFAEQRFAWPRVAEQFSNLYKRLDSQQGK